MVILYIEIVETDFFNLSEDIQTESTKFFYFNGVIVNLYHFQRKNRDIS